MGLEDDYLVRTIKKLVEAIARIAGLRKEGALDEAQAAVEDAYRALGVGRATVGRLDPASVALLLGSRDKLAAMVRLVDEESELARALGDTTRADRLAAKARALANALADSSRED
jgi:hypothetical protein